MVCWTRPCGRGNSVTTTTKMVNEYGKLFLTLLEREARGQLLPSPFSKGAKGTRSALFRSTFLLWRHPYLLPHVFSRFEEIHINIAIVIILTLHPNIWVEYVSRVTLRIEILISRYIYIYSILSYTKEFLRIFQSKRKVRPNSIQGTRSYFIYDVTSRAVADLDRSNRSMCSSQKSTMINFYHI